MLRSFLVVVVAAGSIGAMAALAAPPVRVLVSGAGVPDCSGPGQTRGYEVEPSLAADPSGSLLVGAWQQDRRRSGSGSIANMIGVSKDGGATWDRQLVTAVSKCGGGPTPAISDPWAAVAPDGTIYVASIGVGGNELGQNTIFVQSSRDGGASWSRVALPTSYSDKPTMAVDPVIPGRAWITWTEAPDVGEFISRTDDFGATWSTGKPVSTQDPRFGSPKDVHLLPLAADRLIALATHNGFRDDYVDLVARVSDDGGDTWSSGRRLTKFPLGSVHDADGRLFRADSVIFGAAAGPGGAGYAVLQAGGGRIAIVRTLDAGRTWSRSNVVGRARYATGSPVVAASPDGTSVAVSFISLDRDRKGDGVASTRYRIAVSHDRGSTWQTSPLTPAFNARAGRTNGTPFLGDYTGLVPLGAGGRFGALVSVARPLAGNGPTDIVFVKP